MQLAETDRDGTTKNEERIKEAKIKGEKCNRLYSKSRGLVT